MYQSFYKQQEYKFSSTFIKKEEIKKKWLHNLNRKFIPETLSVCSEHFEPSSFKPDLQAELMGTKPRKILKNDAVPTIFKLSQDPSRKRISLLERENKQPKKQLAQEALGSYEKMITQTQKEVSCSTKDVTAVTEIGTQNSAKTKSVPTQYRKEDFQEESQDIEKRQALIVKVSKPIRKCEDMAVNTDITFQPYEITKSQNDVQYNEPVTADKGQTTQDEDSDDESYCPSSDSFDDSDKEETFDKEQPDKNLQPGTKLVVFWSFIVTLLKVSRVCFHPVQDIPKRYESSRRCCLRMELQTSLTFTIE